MKTFLCFCAVFFIVTAVDHFDRNMNSYLFWDIVIATVCLRCAMIERRRAPQIKDQPHD